MKINFISVVFIFVAVILSGCGILISHAQQAEVNKVCMVTDKYMGAEQIPVLVDGKTYYGCCEGCAGKLQENRKNVRFSQDPVTGKQVDKASAFIAYVTDGSNDVFYFESEKNYRQYLDNFKGLPMSLRALK